MDKKRKCEWCKKEDLEENMFCDDGEWYHDDCHDKATDYVREKYGC